jgi:hypothetical protein
MFLSIINACVFFLGINYPGQTKREESTNKYVTTWPGKCALPETVGSLGQAAITTHPACSARH